LIALKCCLVSLITVALVCIEHNKETARVTMVNLGKAQARPFDGGSTVKAMRTWQPK